MFLIKVVVIFLCLHFTLSVKDTYRAAVVYKDVEFASYASIISEAGKSNADILVLQSPKNFDTDKLDDSDYYDEAVRTISEAAKQNGVYVVAHLYEKARCLNRYELIRSNQVFDRQGSVVSVYRKPVNDIANCTEASSGAKSFTTDFGVTFGVLMEEDLVLQNPKNMESLKNFVVVGSWSSEVPFLSASQFSSSWAYVTNANLISSAGIYAGDAGSTGAGTTVVFADLQKDGESDQPMNPPVATPTKLHVFPAEDLSQYIIRPLNLEASVRGYTEAVCHEKFCCEFYVKTSSAGPNSDMGYGLAAFAGPRHFGGSHYIGTQTCAMIACAGQYKRSCPIGVENDSEGLHFDRIIINGNFSKNSVQFPVIMTTDSPVSFNFDASTVKNSDRVSVEVTDSANLMSFGIFGRDFLKDFEIDYDYGKENMTEGLTSDMSEYLSTEDVQEFFDYVWIRLRVLIFVVSIYILEML